jgi:hypothetical protein
MVMANICYYASPSSAYYSFRDIRVIEVVKTAAGGCVRKTSHNTQQNIWPSPRNRYAILIIILETGLFSFLYYSCRHKNCGNKLTGMSHGRVLPSEFEIS